jgi:hypothetical protein
MSEVYFALDAICKLQRDVINKHLKRYIHIDLLA